MIQDSQGAFGLKFSIVKVAPGKTIINNTLVAYNASGLLVPPDDATAVRIAGVAGIVDGDGSGGPAGTSVTGDGTASMTVQSGIYSFDNDATNPLTVGDIGSAAYAVDNNTVSVSSNGGKRLCVGTFVGFYPAPKLDGVTINKPLVAIGPLTAGEIRALVLDAASLRQYSYAKQADATGSAATSETTIDRVLDTIAIDAVFIEPDGTLTADDTHYATITVYKRASDGSGTATAIASQTTKVTGGSGNWTAFAKVAVPLVGTPTVNAGDLLTFAITKSDATGVVVPRCKIAVEAHKILCRRLKVTS